MRLLFVTFEDKKKGPLAVMGTAKNTRVFGVLATLLEGAWRHGQARSRVQKSGSLFREF